MANDWSIGVSWRDVVIHNFDKLCITQSSSEPGQAFSAALRDAGLLSASIPQRVQHHHDMKRKPQWCFLFIGQSSQ